MNQAWLLDNPHGNYRFLTGIAPYSSGVVAMPGHEIIHVTLAHPIPYRQGFERIEQLLGHVGRSKQTLCAVELRLPAPLSFDGFADFNREYQELLASWNLPLDGRNPVARTNIAPALMPPAEPSLYAFAYTMPLADRGYQGRRSIADLHRCRRRRSARPVDSLPFSRRSSRERPLPPRCEKKLPPSCG